MLTGMLFGGISFTYFSFYCHSLLMPTYIALILCFYIIAIIWCHRRYIKRLRKSVLSPNDRFPEFSFSLSTYICFSSFLPAAVVYLFKQEYSTVAGYRDVMFYSGVSPLLISLGIVAFAQGGLPERLCGRLGLKEDTFDSLGHSHQWWHLLSAAVMFNWVHVIVSHHRLRSAGTCM